MGQHLAAVAYFLELGELDRALEHAANATRRAGRVAVVRETHGMVHYHRGEWAKALAEFRTARRLSGTDHLLPYLADVERALGRPERAIEWGQSPAASSLGREEAVELAIVVAGARRDLGQGDAARQLLEDLASKVGPTSEPGVRVRYALADVLAEQGDLEQARRLFADVVDRDVQQSTDAAERLEALDGVDWIDAGSDSDDETSDDEISKDDTNNDRAGRPGDTDMQATEHDTPERNSHG